MSLCVSVLTNAYYRFQPTNHLTDEEQWKLDDMANRL